MQEVCYCGAVNSWPIHDVCRHILLISRALDLMRGIIQCTNICPSVKGWFTFNVTTQARHDVVFVAECEQDHLI
jgi:hypothetical protein